MPGGEGILPPAVAFRLPASPYGQPVVLVTADRREAIVVEGDRMLKEPVTRGQMAGQGIPCGNGRAAQPLADLIAEVR